MSNSMRDRAASLIAKANNPAASENEAEACMQKAMDLMGKFGFTMDDVLGDRAESIGMSGTPWMNGRPGGAMFSVHGAIAAFTNTRASFKGTVTRGTSMTYHGYGAERDLAVWLHGHILNAIKVQSAAYNPDHRNAAVRARDRKSFAIYMARRISTRLYSMVETLDYTGRGTGTDVMVVKNKKLDEHYEGLGFPKAIQRKQSLYRDGAIAGSEAGEAVSLHRPISEATGPLQITSQ
ncbi:DUF2786 domain-containing protein [Roseobacter sp.]|uniref:DUF2786 domain-containing protein n=1 Tax=Roseobacter sp. TaxID=1907202 RepID=UPI003859BCF9